jgi:hypothetical protein
VVRDVEGRLEEQIHHERGWNVEVVWYGSIGSGNSNRSAGTDNDTGTGDTAVCRTGIDPERGTGEPVSAGAGEELYGDYAYCG